MAIRDDLPSTVEDGDRATWLEGEGEMRRRIRAFDWSNHALGPTSAWPEELRTSVGLCLAMAFPACVFWGRDGIQIYNDPYAAVMRRKHPAGLGQSWLATWPERAGELTAMRDRVYGGHALLEDDQPWTLDREGELQEYTFTISMTPIPDKDGVIQGMFHTATETTDAVKARRLRRADELTAVFDSMPDAVYVGTLDGITHCNQHGLEMLGAASLADLQRRIGEIGHRFAVSSIATGELIPEDQLSFVRALTTGKTVIEDVMATRQDTGEVVYIRGASAPILEGETVIGAVAINTDITEQYKARQLLDQSEKRFRALVSASSDVVFRLSPDWSDMEVLHADGKPHTFFGNTFKSAGNWLQEHVSGDDLPRVLQAVEGAIRTKAVFEMQYRTRLVNGTMGWIAVRAVPLLDGEGELTEWFGTASDVTAQKVSEQTLIKTEKLAAVGRLASTIAHEINNPLEAVTNVVYLLQQEQELSEPAQRYLKVIDEELARASHMTKQTLSFSRGGNSVQLLRLGELVQDVLSILGPRLRNKHITIHDKLDHDAVLTGINGELRQVVTNLLTNSIDAVQPGGAIWVRTGRTATRGEESLRLTVADNGHGIPVQAQEQIFEPFFSLKPEIGTGLGLWVTREIIDRHNGSIRVRSSDRKGHSGTVISILFRNVSNAVSF